MIWKGTTHIGCADNGDDLVWICRYYSGPLKANDPQYHTIANVRSGYVMNVFPAIKTKEECEAEIWGETTTPTGETTTPTIDTASEKVKAAAQGELTVEGLEVKAGTTTQAADTVPETEKGSDVASAAQDTLQMEKVVWALATISLWLPL